MGDSLLSVLRQLRAGYDLRPEGFPQSVVLCGVRDVRDYRIHSSTEGQVVAGGSAFNIKSASLRLGDFSQEEVGSLLLQHTAETGQVLTHLDRLADKLREERVRRVVAPLLSGGAEPEFTTRDLEYVRDLGLIAADDPPRIANPIYAEVVPREPTYATQAGLVQDVAWYVDRAGRLDMRGMIGAFHTFFREHSEHWVERFQYREAGPQLLL